MRIECSLASENKSDYQFIVDEIGPNSNLVSRFQIVVCREFLRDRNRAWSAEPLLNIKALSAKIGRFQGPERFVRKDIDP